MKDWTRKIIGLSLVALFAGYYGGTTLFYHLFDDGVLMFIQFDIGYGR